MKGRLSRTHGRNLAEQQGRHLQPRHAWNIRSMRVKWMTCDYPETTPVHKSRYDIENVSPSSSLPLFSPLLNQRIRWAEVPCVNA